MAILEIACFNPESAVVASEAGADRIELCDNQDVGGTTPSPQWLADVKARVNIPVFVMVRPREGGFIHTESEVQQMVADVDRLKSNADGFVFGILDQVRRIDIRKTAMLVRKAHPLPCTFHRAFDQAPEPFEALEAVIATGCSAILTSGGAPSVHDGMEVLRHLVKKAEGRVDIIPGGGLRLQNLSHIRRMTGACTFHSSALAPDATLPDEAEIRHMKRLLVEDLGDSGTR